MDKKLRVVFSTEAEEVYTYLSCSKLKVEKTILAADFYIKLDPRFKDTLKQQYEKHNVEWVLN